MGTKVEQENKIQKKGGDEIGDICVVTQPARRETGKNHAYTLLNILSAITSVSIITANLSDDSEIRDEYEVTEISKKGTGDNILVSIFRFMANQLKMCAAIRRRDEKIILFFGATSYVLPIIFSRIIGKKVVVEPRGDVPLSLRLKWEKEMPNFLAVFLASLVSILERIGYRSSSAIISYTPSMADQIGVNRYGDKVYTKGARYIDTEKFDVSTPYSEREECVGFIGRLDVEKGIPQLAKVAKEIPAKFIFVGDGDYREMLEKKLADEIEGGKVEMVGWVDHEEVTEQLNRLKLHILASSPTEGLPTAILESFGCGTPVYATPVSGVPDVVIEGQTGFLMDEKDGDEIAKKVEKILERDDLPEMSGNCRELVEEKYSFEAAVERYRSILKDLS